MQPSGEQYRVRARSKQYYSMMSLISDQLAIPGFGLCSGMGSCGTCMVDVCNKVTGGKRSHLSCDLPVNDELENMVIVIREPAY